MCEAATPVPTTLQQVSVHHRLNYVNAVVALSAITYALTVPYIQWQGLSLGKRSPYWQHLRLGPQGNFKEKEYVNQSFEKTQAFVRA